MAMVPGGGGDEGAWTDSGDGFDDSSSAPPRDAGKPWSLGGPNHPTFCFFKGAADGLAGGLMGSVFGFVVVVGKILRAVERPAQRRASLPPPGLLPGVIQGLGAGVGPAADGGQVEVGMPDILLGVPPLPGAGLVKKQGFKGALREGGSSAKTFAILSGVHSIVSCYLKKVRGREDAWNAGIAGCATGLALSTPGTPQALAQSCLSFGAFSFVLEYMNQTRPAIAATASSEPSSQPHININNHLHLHLNLPALPPFTLPPLSWSFLNQEFGGKARPL